MLCPADGDLQPETAFLCEDCHQCLSSPQDSSSSAQSYYDPVTFGTPVSAVSKCALLLPANTFGLNGLSLAEVPTDASWEPNSIGSFAHPGYVEPTPATAIYQIAATYGFTPFMFVLGTSYFRRLAASNSVMLQAGLASPQFCAFMLPMEALPLGKESRPLVGAIHVIHLPSTEAWLALIHLTCIYLAAKNVEHVPCNNLLQTMMGHIYGADPCNVTNDLVVELELECLQALDWRLGPFYRADS